MPNQFPEHATKLTAPLPVNANGEMGTNYPITAPPIAPPATGGLSYVAANGLVDGETIVLTSSDFNLEEPDKRYYIGFDLGWMNDNPVDTSMQDVTISQPDGDISYQYDYQSNRYIKLKDGIKVLESFIHPFAGGGFNSAGNLTVDTDTLWPAGTCFTMCSLTRGDIGVGGDGPDTQYQWKQDRMMNFPMGGTNPNSRNSAYMVGWDYGDNLQNKVVVSNGGTTGLGDSALLNDVWAATQWTWKHNTPDLADGSMRLICKYDGIDGVTDNFVDSGNIADVIIGDFAERPKVFLIEDYVGSRNGTTTPYDITIDRANLYWKVNGHGFYLCDKADPLELEEIPVPMIPISYPAANKVELHLFKCFMTSYIGKFIHVRDKYDVLIDVMEIK